MGKETPEQRSRRLSETNRRSVAAGLDLSAKWGETSRRHKREGELLSALYQSEPKIDDEDTKPITVDARADVDQGTVTRLERWLRWVRHERAAWDDQRGTTEDGADD